MLCITHFSLVLLLLLCVGFFYTFHYLDPWGFTFFSHSLPSPAGGCGKQTVRWGLVAGWARTKYEIGLLQPVSSHCLSLNFLNYTSLQTLLPKILHIKF